MGVLPSTQPVATLGSSFILSFYHAMPRMPARSVCLVTLSPSEAGPGRFGRQASVTDIYHAMPCHLEMRGFQRVQI